MSEQLNSQPVLARDDGFHPLDREATVTLGVRLVSIADDDIQHAGQAKYVRGLLERRRVGG